MGGVRIAGRVGKRRLATVISFHLNFSLSLAKQTPTHMHTVHKCIYIHRTFITFSLTTTWMLSCTGAGIQKGRGNGASDPKTESKRGSASKRGRGGERAGTMSTAWLPAQSAEIHSSAQKLREEKQTKRSSFGRETSSDSAKAWNSATKHKLQRAKKGI